MPSEGLQFPRIQDPDLPGLVGGGRPARGRLQESLVQHGPESREFGNEEVDAFPEQGLRGLVPVSGVRTTMTAGFPSRFNPSAMKAASGRGMEPSIRSASKAPATAMRVRASSIPGEGWIAGAGEKGSSSRRSAASSLASLLT
jgi:hypothetical protein